MKDNESVSQTTAPSGVIAKKIALQPPHIQVGIEAYRRALGRREDWHSAVIAAIEASIAVMKEPIDG